MFTREGEAPGALHDVPTGAVGVGKSGRSIPHDPGTFIGEIAGRQAPRHAVTRLTSHDMTPKVGRA